jgi:hypothetical protein
MDGRELIERNEEGLRAAASMGAYARGYEQALADVLEASREFDWPQNYVVYAAVNAVRDRGYRAAPGDAS